LDTLYKDNLNVTDDKHNVKEFNDDPFKYYLDIKLMRTTIDARIFHAMKDIINDLNISHNTKIS